MLFKHLTCSDLYYLLLLHLHREGAKFDLLSMLYLSQDALDPY